MNPRMFVGAMMLVCSATIAQAQLTYVSQFHAVAVAFSNPTTATSGSLFYEAANDSSGTAFQRARVFGCGIETDAFAGGAFGSSGMTCSTTCDVQFTVDVERSFTLNAMTDYFINQGSALPANSVVFNFTGGEFNVLHSNQRDQFQVSGTLVPGTVYRLRFFARGQSGGPASLYSSRFSATLDLGLSCGFGALICHPDQDHNGSVGIGDLAQVIVRWGQQSPVANFYGDVNGDRAVDLADIAQIINVWGQDCPTG